MPLKMDIEGTLRNPETTLGTTRQFAEAGASTHLIVLGVSPAESWSGCLERYINALEEGQAACWTPLEAHNAWVGRNAENFTCCLKHVAVVPTCSMCYP